MEAVHLFRRLGRIWKWKTSELHPQKTNNLHQPCSEPFHIFSMPAKLLTLCCANLILPKLTPSSLQRRREDVQQQLCLWPEAQSPHQEPNIWEELAPQTRQKVIVLLAKLISKTACPTPREDNDER